MPDENQQRRAEDLSFWCLVARRFSEVWDFVDRRQIDAYLLSLAIFYGTVRITEWAMNFAERFPDKALAIAAVAAPYMALQAAALKFFFDARQGSFERKDKG